MRKLAALSGVSPTTICDLENGNTKKHAFETMVKLSKVLGIDMNNFVENVNTFYMDTSKDYTIIIKRIEPIILSRCCLFFFSSNSCIRAGLYLGPLL